MRKVSTLISSPASLSDDEMLEMRLLSKACSAVDGYPRYHQSYPSSRNFYFYFHRKKKGGGGM